MPALWYPGKVEKSRQRFGCTNCDEQPVFDNLPEYTAHVGKCVRRNAPEAPPRNAYNDYNDPELVAYVKKANREGVKLRGIVGSKGTPKHRRKTLPPIKVEEDSPNA
jgi:hypothetical protein